jgi:phosphoadenosine phosphosulfate reductase
VGVPGGEDVTRLTERFEGAPPQDVLRWALTEVDRIAVASSFQAEGTCVLHMATRIRPDVPVLFLDTGFHFARPWHSSDG